MNAGVSMRVKMMDFPEENEDYMVDVNFRSPYKITKLVVKHMAHHKSGHICFISSLSVIFPSSLRSLYAGTKSAMSTVYESLRSELYDQNIKVSVIYPGYVQTDISKNSLTNEPNQRLNKTD